VVVPLECIIIHLMLLKLQHKLLPVVVVLLMDLVLLDSLVQVMVLFHLLLELIIKTILMLCKTADLEVEVVVVVQHFLVVQVMEVLVVVE